MIEYVTIPNFLSKSECKDIINLSLNNLNLSPATMGHNTERLDETYRKSNVGFAQYKKTFPFLKERITNTLSSIIKIKGYDLNFESNFQFTEYETGGHYDWHTDSDVSNFDTTGRYCSLVIQLNEEYEGAELEIVNNADKKIVLEKGIGNLFIFQSSLKHRVDKITNGKRYSLVNWFNLKPIEGFKKTLI